MTLIEELEKLSLSPDFMTEDQTRQVIQLINERLAEILRPHIIDILWRNDAQGGGIILSPLNPTMCIDTTSRGGAKPFHILGITSDKGIWAWLCENEKPVWIKNIKKNDLTKPMRNEATKDFIKSEYLDFFHETDTIMAVPLITRNRLWGVYSIEWPESKGLSRETLELVEQLAKPIARIRWKVETLKYSQNQTNRAISLFSDTIRKTFIHEELSPTRTGFIARPFDRKFKILEQCLAKYLIPHGIHIEHFRHPPGERYVIDQIIKSISSAHFGIVDITEINLNVVLELGVMMAQNKEILLFRRRSDRLNLPFDISPLNLYKYDVKPRSEVQVWSPGSHSFEPIERTLEDFVRRLEGNPSFRAAKKYKQPRRNRKGKASQTKPPKE